MKYTFWKICDQEDVQNGIESEAALLVYHRIGDIDYFNRRDRGGFFVVQV